MSHAFFNIDTHSMISNILAPGWVMQHWHVFTVGLLFYNYILLLSIECLGNMYQYFASSVLVFSLYGQ